MDKYEDLGLEASKFIEDLNMYEASKDGLFRMKRDAGNNPDFEETRRVFASKMTKIHMQKQQEEIAKSRLNGGHGKVSEGTFYTKDRPPISSCRQGGEAAAKPPILSGPMAGTASISQHFSYEGQKHHPATHHDAQGSRAYSYGNSYDSYPHPPISPPNSHIQASPGHPSSPSGAWGQGNSLPWQASSSSGSSSNSTSPGVPGADQIHGVTSAPSQAYPDAGKSDSVSPTGAYRVPAEPYNQPPPHRTSTQHFEPSPALRPVLGDPRLNGVPQSIRSAQVTPPAHSQPEVQQSSPKAGQMQGHAQVQGGPVMPVSQATPSAQLAEQPAHSEAPSPPRALKLPCHTLHIQPEHGPSAAEIKLEALTDRLEKEMDAQPKADYFGKPDAISPSCFFSSVNRFLVCNF